MAKKKVSRKKSPCPDPELYEWVNRGSGHWRRKKEKGTAVNNSLTANNVITTILAPAIKRIRNRLEEYTYNLDMGPVQARISGQLSKSFKENSQFNYAAMKGFDFQKEWFFEKLLLSQHKISKANEKVIIQIPVYKGLIKKYNNLVTDFYFEAILLRGDALKDEPLVVEYALSAPYSFTNSVTETCTLILPLPENNIPWMLMLKVSCLEGNEMARHVKHYGMKVVEVS